MIVFNVTMQELASAAPGYPRRGLLDLLPSYLVLLSSTFVGRVSRKHRSSCCRFHLPPEAFTSAAPAADRTSKGSCR